MLKRLGMVSVTLTPTATGLYTLTGRVFTLVELFPGILVHLSACVAIPTGTEVMYKHRRRLHVSESSPTSTLD